MNIRSEGKLKGQGANNIPFLIHPGEPIDPYSEYLLEGPQPAHGSSNSRNLFDDSNRIDGKWLKTARDYLEKLR